MLKSRWDLRIGLPMSVSRGLMAWAMWHCPLKSKDGLLIFTPIVPTYSDERHTPAVTLLMRCCKFQMLYVQFTM
jgi:hypothetical protein